ncbi:MAG TPA: hypothetical protein VKB79_05170 [Bryobacteraceae bacterium]|nr:hypothetical protein [Bryobacteraceae bacterium]
MMSELYERLIDAARQRVRSGAMTERGLARLCGMSQPHMHNVLKSFRSLSIESADRLLHALDLTIPALLFSLDRETDASIRIIPMLRARIGTGAAASLTAFRGFMPFPSAQAALLVDPVVAQLGPDLVMPAALKPNDYALLDQNPLLRRNPGGGGIWVIEENGILRPRYLKLGGTRIYIADEITLRDPPKWEPVSLERRDIREIVRARIVWIGRNLPRD